MTFAAQLPRYTRLTPSIAPASGSFAYQTSDAAGIKIASRDLTGPTTTLALVSRAGTRYQWTPNLSEGLEKFAFKVGWHSFPNKPTLIVDLRRNY